MTGDPKSFRMLSMVCPELATLAPCERCYDVGVRHDVKSLTDERGRLPDGTPCRALPSDLSAARYQRVDRAIFPDDVELVLTCIVRWRTFNGGVRVVSIEDLAVRGHRK